MSLATSSTLKCNRESKKLRRCRDDGFTAGSIASPRAQALVVLSPVRTPGRKEGGNHETPLHMNSIFLPLFSRCLSLSSFFSLRRRRCPLAFSLSLFLLPFQVRFHFTSVSQSRIMKQRWRREGGSSAIRLSLGESVTQTAVAVGLAPSSRRRQRHVVE